MFTFSKRTRYLLKRMRHMKKILAFLIIIFLTISVSQIGFLWGEYTELKQEHKTKLNINTIDPWVQKHWNHIKILSNTVKAMQVPKKILLWTKFFGITDFIPNFSSLGCLEPKFKCTVTSNRDSLNKSDAIIFHLRDINLDDMPKFRNQNQIWILLNHESPVHTPEKLKQLDGIFNWTATYRYDSEILLSPTIKKTDERNVLKIKPSSKKNKMIAWLVSNCETPSKREKYVQELRKYIPVDIYGTCGTFSCLPKMSDDCYDKLDKKYRFYLSFENSICKDYVTEKFFRILRTDMIPVVMGGANYSSIVPNNSYIDALAFTPRDLATFLLQVAKDDKKYISYFEWKKNFKLVDEHYACQICSKLHDSISEPNTYHSISNWWFGDSNCRSWQL